MSNFYTPKLDNKEMPSSVMKGHPLKHTSLIPFKNPPEVSPYNNESLKLEPSILSNSI